MTVPRVSIRLLALITALAMILAAFFLFVRPWYLSWGATDQETRRVLPGDEIISNAAGQETRAITIHASVGKIWPWLAQLGQDRGGFYSFDLLENLVGCKMPTEDRLRPGKQSWHIGDKLWMYPEDQADGLGFATLRTYVPGLVLAFGTHAPGTPINAPEDGSWAFVLNPVADGTTRLIIRGRGAAGRSLLGTVFDRTVFEPLHFVMERRMMTGIKQLAEGSDRGRLLNHVHVALWTITFAMFVTTIILVIRGRRWLWSLAAFVAAAVIFQVLTLVQPSPIIGTLLVVGLGVSMPWSRRASSPPIATMAKAA